MNCAQDDTNWKPIGYGYLEIELTERWALDCNMSAILKTKVSRFRR